MSKIGTVHVEIKPMLNEDALSNINDLVEAAAARIDETLLRAAMGVDRQRLAGTITLDHRTHRILIDGIPFPYWIGDGPIVNTDSDAITSLTVEILADRVEVVGLTGD